MITDHLPIPATPFIGRIEELASIAALLAEPHCRLLTLVGLGGIGKTRLALEVARTHQDAYEKGVYFVPLQPLASPAFLVSTIAEAVDFQFYPGSDPKQELLDFFREKSLLLVLDNFEHLLDAAVLLSEILAYAPEVRMLVTSRERLHLLEEWVLDVQGLAFPLNEREIGAEDYSAVQLFVQNARRARNGFELTDTQTSAVIRICQLVGGMPLAIELAAAWVRAISCEEIASEIEHGQDILETPARNVEPRHRTMQATIEPTWGRLSQEERDVFQSLSVFRGGFTREVASTLGASLRTLSALVDKSLLKTDAAGRYDIHELLRQHGEEQLAQVQPDYERAHDRHCEYYAEFIRQQHLEIRGAKPQRALDAIERELGNIRAAWVWATRRAKRSELRQFLGGLEDFFFLRNRYQDGETCFAEAVASLDTVKPGWEKDDLLACVLALHTLFYARLRLSEIHLGDEAEESYQKSLTILRNLDDPGAHPETALAFVHLGLTRWRVQPVEGRQLCQESIILCREHGYPYELMQSLGCLATIDVSTQDNMAEGKQASEEGLALARRLGSLWWNGYLCTLRGEIAVWEGDYVEAKRLFQEADLAMKESDDRVNGVEPLVALAEIAREQGGFDEARQRYQAALVTYQGTGVSRLVLRCLAGIAHLFAVEGETVRAAELSVFVLNYPDLDVRNRKDQATALLNTLENELSVAAFAAAVERGRAMELDTVVASLLNELQDNQGAPDVQFSAAVLKANQRLIEPLSERELEVLQFIALGLSNSEIAERLFVGISTVKKHINHIYGKLGVETRAQALARINTLNLL